MDDSREMGEGLVYGGSAPSGYLRTLDKSSLPMAHFKVFQLKIKYDKAFALLFTEFHGMNSNLNHNCHSSLASLILSKNYVRLVRVILCFYINFMFRPYTHTHTHSHTHLLNIGKERT